MYDEGIKKDLHFLLEQNVEVRAMLRQKLGRPQHSFIVGRDDLEKIGMQLVAFGIVAQAILDEKDLLLTEIKTIDAKLA